MDLVERSATACGVNHSDIHREVFQSLTGDPFDTATLRRLSDDEGVATATVYLNGECITTEWPRNTPLLDVLLSRGHNAPYSCREGACSARSEEHTSELQSLMRISYAAFCLKKKKQKT